MTTKRHKSFGTKPKVYEPLSFSLYEEDFHVLPMIQGKTIIDFARKARDEDPSMVLEFFDKVLLPESHERFTALIESDDKIVEMETLSEILEWLIEEYTNRPEGQ